MQKLTDLWGRLAAVLKPSAQKRADDLVDDLVAEDPILRPGQEPPGGWVETKGGPRVWKGRSTWRTEHGDAVVAWLLGHPSQAWNVRFQESRIDIRQVLDFGWRRPATGTRRWIYGNIEIGPQDVLFSDRPQPIYKPDAPVDELDLEVDLSRSEEFRTELNDFRFAQAVYGTLKNQSFLNIAARTWWHCGDRQAAYIAAHLGYCGDSYNDFFLDSDFKGFPSDVRRRQARVVNDRLEGVITGRIPVVGDDRRTLVISPEVMEDLKRFQKTRLVDVPPDHFFYRLIILQKQEMDEIFANKEMFDLVEDHIRALGWRPRYDNEATS